MWLIDVTTPGFENDMFPFSCEAYFELYSIQIDTELLLINHFEHVFQLRSEEELRKVNDRIEKTKEQLNNITPQYEQCSKMEENATAQ